MQIDHNSLRTYAGSLSAYEMLNTCRANRRDLRANLQDEHPSLVSALVAFERYFRGIGRKILDNSQEEPTRLALKHGPFHAMLVQILQADLPEYGPSVLRELLDCAAPEDSLKTGERWLERQAHFLAAKLEGDYKVQDFAKSGERLRINFLFGPTDSRWGSLELMRLETAGCAKATFPIWKSNQYASPAPRLSSWRSRMRNERAHIKEAFELTARNVLNWPSSADLDRDTKDRIESMIKRMLSDLSGPQIKALRAKPEMSKQAFEKALSAF